MQPPSPSRTRALVAALPLAVLLVWGCNLVDSVQADKVLAGTVIATPAGDVYLNPTGNSGLAKGGSGDVLTGLLGGLLAQGYSAGEAAQLGVFLHGLAADLAAEGSSPYALTATDVIERFGAAFRRLEKRGAAPEPGGAIL